MTPAALASWINQRRLDLACGLSLLTRLPAGWLAPAASRTSTTPWPLARSVWCWPVIAMLIGAVTGCVLALLRMAHVPALAAAALALTCQTILTGGLHEDGLADMADGCGGATPDRRLAIMRDSRVGSYGVMALGLGLLVRVSALAALPVQACILVCATAACLARMAMVFVPILIPPARPDGLARALSARPVWSFLAAVLMASGVALGLPMVGRNVGVTFPLPLLSALLPGGVSYATALLVALCAKRQLGGYTGDVLGCCAVVAECLLLCLYAALLCP